MVYTLYIILQFGIFQSVKYHNSTKMAELHFDSTPFSLQDYIFSGYNY